MNPCFSCRGGWAIVLVIVALSLRGEGNPVPTAMLGTVEFKVEVEIAPSFSGADGTRFDRTSRVRQVTADGVTFLGAGGLIDEFGISGSGGVFGYDAARPGEAFMKVGNGILIRPDEQPYRFDTAFPVRLAFPTQIIHRSEEALTLEQSGRLCGWNYRYRKHYEVDPELRLLRISYHVKNTGRETMELEQYNHGYLSFKNGPVTMGTRILTDFPLEEYRQNWISAKDHTIRILSDIRSRCYYSSVLPGGNPTHSMVFQAPGGGLAIAISGNRPISRFALYAEAGAACPELFIRFKVVPGEEITWSRTFHFQTGVEDGDDGYPHGSSNRHGVLGSNSFSNMAEIISVAK